MEFLLLGPLVVRDDGGRELMLSSPKQRALLSVLLLGAGEVVSRERLFDAIWPAGPPATAETALHGHVSQLRKLIGPDRVVTRPPGYCVPADASELELAPLNLVPVAEVDEVQGDWTHFEGFLMITGQETSTQNADVLIYAAAASEVDDAWNAAAAARGKQDVEPHWDSSPSRYWGTVFDPDGNRVYVGFRSPVL